jgi:hypothetical protein
MQRRVEEGAETVAVNPLNHSGYYIYHFFNVQNSEFCLLSCIYAFRVIPEINSDDLLNNINQLGFIMETQVVSLMQKLSLLAHIDHFPASKA